MASTTLTTSVLKLHITKNEAIDYCNICIIFKFSKLFKHPSMFLIFWQQTKNKQRITLG